MFKTKHRDESTVPRPKVGKDAAAAIRKNTGVKIARVILWIMLAFIFARGVMSIIRSSDTTSAMAEIRAFEAQQSALQSEQTGLLVFAENFAKEYLSYAPDSEADYAARLSQYALPIVYQDIDLKGAASVRSIKAYRAEAVRDTQFDVYVSAAVTFISYSTVPETGEVIARASDSDVILRIPLAAQDGKYIVEDTPLFIEQSNTLSDYKSVPYSGQTASSETVTAIYTAATNFFTAYYKDQASVIAYYLAPDADPADFMGLNGQLAFDGISDCMVYEDGTGYRVLVTLSLLQPNGQSTAQHIQLHMITKDGQYYVQTMDTRTRNIGN